MTQRQKYTIISVETKKESKGVRMKNKVLYFVFLVVAALGLFAALYTRQPYGFAVAAAGVLGFAYFFIRGEKK